MIDLRSDTATRPSPGMRQAMATAEDDAVECIAAGTDDDIEQAIELVPRAPGAVVARA